MKIANIDRENLNISWTTWGISIKFSGKMWLIILLKVTKKTTGKVKFGPPSPPAVLGLSSVSLKENL